MAPQDETLQEELSKADALEHARANLAKGRQNLAEAETVYQEKVEAARRGTISTGVAAAADKIEILSIRLRGLEDGVRTAQLELDRDVAERASALMRDKVAKAAVAKRLEKLQAQLTETIEAMTAEINESNAALQETNQLISSLGEDSLKMLRDEYGIRLVRGMTRGVQIDGTVYETRSPKQVLERVIPEAIHAAGYRKQAINL